MTTDEKELRVVFQTSQHEEASSLAAMLADSDIPSEVRIVVQAERESEAVALIEGYMRSIGAAPHEPKPEAEAEELLPCPNCENPGIALRRNCAGCGYEILASAAPAVAVARHAPEARSFCPGCRGPLTLAAGKCLACGDALEPLESGDRLCPSLEHVLYRDTVGGAVCKACRRVWVD